MNESSPKLVIGFITYGKTTSRYLPYFLPSLISQTYQDFKIVIIDNTELEQNENRDYFANNFPEIDFSWAGKNLGFAKAYNLLIEKAFKLGAEFFLVINPDTLLLPDTLEKLVSAMEADRSLGSISPKILKWGFDQQQLTQQIDSCGLVMRRSLQFFDLGQGELDEGKFGDYQILGPSGAAAFFRLSALEQAKEAGQYYDEHFFMYKEDCDLALRLRLKHFKTKFISDAIVYHDRTVAGKGENILARVRSRKSKSRQVRAWSFVNQQMIYCKYWGTLSFADKLRLIGQQVQLLAYIILFEQFLLLELPTLAKQRRGLNYY